MAIDRGPFNLLQDDDGSNLTGSIWDKAAIARVLLDPIDNSLVTHGTFTPTDLSGAGLAFGFSQGKWSKFDKLVWVWVQFVYPATSSGAYAKVGGLPFVVRTPVGVAQGYGPLKAWWLLENDTAVQIHDPATFAQLNNTQVSGANLIISAVYRTD